MTRKRRLDTSHKTSINLITHARYNSAQEEAYVLALPAVYFEIRDDNASKLNERAAGFSAQ
jgi:hypothetical protein